MSSKSCPASFFILETLFPKCLIVTTPSAPSLATHKPTDRKHIQSCPYPDNGRCTTNGRGFSHDSCLPSKSAPLTNAPPPGHEDKLPLGPPRHEVKLPEGPPKQEAKLLGGQSSQGPPQQEVKLLTGHIGHKSLRCTMRKVSCIEACVASSTSGSGSAD